MSLPTVIAAMTFLTASFITSRSEEASSVRSSPTSPRLLSRKKRASWPMPLTAWRATAKGAGPAEEARGR